MLAERLEFGDVNFFEVGKVRYGAVGRHHAVGDFSAQTDDLDVLGAVSHDLGRTTHWHGWRSSRRPTSDVAVEVGMADPSRRSGTGNELEVDVGGSGSLADGGRSQRLRSRSTGNGCRCSR